MSALISLSRNISSVSSAISPLPLYHFDPSFLTAFNALFVGNGQCGFDQIDGIAAHHNLECSGFHYAPHISVKE